MAEARRNNLLRPYRVLDLAEEMGCYAGKILGDFGADVIKVEPPNGASCRRFGPFYHDIPDPNKSLFFWAFNTSKRGITLDITREDGKAIFRELVKKADVVIESFPPGYMDSLGLGYDDLSKINPGLVMTAVTPFGYEGPRRHYKGCDLVANAMSGNQWFAGDEDRPPVRPSFECAHTLSGVLALTGTMAALYYRDTTGEGQFVDVSQQEAVLPVSFTQQQYYDYNQYVIMRHGDRTDPGRVGQPMGDRKVLPCKDGYMTGNYTGAAAQGLYNSLAWMEEEGFDISVVKDKPWYQTKMPPPQLRMAFEAAPQDNDLLIDLVARFVKNKTRREVQVEAAKREIQWFPVDTTADILTDPQLVFRNYWTKVQHPEVGDTVTYPGLSLMFYGTPGKIARRAPLIGEHNDEVYVKELGFTKDRLVLLKGLGVI